MKSDKPSEHRDDLRPQYDFRGGIRGKYAESYQEGTNVVVLDPDIASHFKDSREVNQALRAFLKERGSKR